MNTTSPPNISGAIQSCGIKQRLLRGPSLSLEWPFVVQIGLHVAGEHRHPLDQLGDALQAQKKEADRQKYLDRPAQQTAGIAGNFAVRPRVVEDGPREVRED